MLPYLPSPIRVTPSMDKRVSGTPSRTSRSSTMATSDKDRFWKVRDLQRTALRTRWTPSRAQSPRPDPPPGCCSEVLDGLIVGQVQVQQSHGSLWVGHVPQQAGGHVVVP